MNLISIANLDVGKLFSRERRPPTVLAVEDNTLAAESIREAATIAGFKVIVVPSGEEAIGLLRANGTNYVAAIIDVILPQMSGWALWEKITDEWPALKTVIISVDAKNFENVPPGVPVTIFRKNGRRYCRLFRQLQKELKS